MRLRITLFVGLIAAMALGISSIGTAASGFKVTGGGQTTHASTTGAGDTIAFTAQNVDGSNVDAKGQVQWIDRNDDGRMVGIYHGEVTCLRAVATETEESQGAGIFGGTWTRTPTGELGPFEIFVEDNGEPNQGADQIFIDQNDGNDCSDEDSDDDGRTALGRGNVQVHNAE